MSKNQRVFVALWPPAEVRAALARIAAGLIDRVPEGRAVPAANLHLTLAFIGPLREERVAQLAPLVQRCRFSSFSWRVDRLGAFARARVLWAGGEPSPALEHLAQTVRDLLDRERIDFDRKPFSPHVTLVRDAWRLPAGIGAIAPIDWPCERATLVRSSSGVDGATYTPLTAT